MVSNAEIQAGDDSEAGLSEAFLAGAVEGCGASGLGLILQAPPAAATIVTARTTGHRRSPIRLATMGASPNQLSLKCSSPSRSMVDVTWSPALSHTCRSFGYPAMTPSGVPVKTMSPGLSVKCFEM